MDINTYKEKVAQTLSDLMELGTTLSADVAPIQGLLYRTLHTLQGDSFSAATDGDSPSADTAVESPTLAVESDDNIEAINDVLGDTVIPLEITEPTVYDDEAGGIPLIDGDRPIVSEDGVPVGGVGVNEDGEYATIPGTQSLIDRSNRLLESYGLDEECDDECEMYGCVCDRFAQERRENDGFLRVSYTRLDGNDMTRTNMLDIITHPISTTGLLRFGELRLVTFEEVEDDRSTNVAVFTVNNSDETHLNLDAIAHNLVGYQGVVPFEGIGMVKAQGAVRFID